jgi:hypothetical protein
VLFYDANTGNAEAAFVDTGGTFTVRQDYTGFASWTHITGLDNGVVLLYDANTGKAETDFVDTDGTFTNLMVYARLGSWTNIVGIPLGYSQ